MKRFICLLIILLSFIGLAEQLEIHFIDVGQGDAVLIRSPGGQNVLYDGGRSRLTALNYLRSIGVQSLDMVIASHPDADHIGGLIEAINHFRPRFFMDNGIPHTTQTYENLLLAVDAAGSELLEPFSRRINLGPVALQILPPPGIASWGNNENSVGVIIEFGDFKAGLSGDAEHRQFAWWSEQGFMQPVQVYKSSHHGSPNGDNQTSINGFRPEVVIISVGADNSYGHPASEILQLYQRAGARVYRTDQQGNIVVRANQDGTYTITTDRNVPTPPPPQPQQTPPPPPPPPTQSCCRVCRNGKACGDSCIARDRNCTRPRGCACNAEDINDELHMYALNIFDDFEDISAGTCTIDVFGAATVTF